jgi:hypothetical protein
MIYLFKWIEMEHSPFVFGTTVSQGSFANREQDLERLYSNMLNGINSMLISPRRWGKSSLVEKLILDVRQKNPKICVASIDLFSASSEEEFLELFAREVIKASSTKWEDWMRAGKDFFQQLVPKLSIGLNPKVDFSITFDWKEIRKYRDEILDLPERIARDKGVKYLICLDEFQNLASFDQYEQMEKGMRAVWQRQKLVTYCLYGSRRHMMSDIFSNPSKPFYRFGEVILLEKIKREKWVDFILRKFEAGKKTISPELAELIPEWMEDHSWYVQQLAHYTWQKSSKKVSITNLQKALKELISTNSPFYQREVESLSRGQLNLLKAIANQEEKLTSVEIIDTYKLGTSANVVKNRRVLMNLDIIHEHQGTWDFLDPAFKRWFQNYFLQKPLY